MVDAGSLALWGASALSGTYLRARGLLRRSYADCLLFYKGYHALQSHRIANTLWKRGQRVLALTLQSRISEARARAPARICALARRPRSVLHARACRSAGAFSFTAHTPLMACLRGCQARAASKAAAPVLTVRRNGLITSPCASPFFGKRCLTWTSTRLRRWAREFCWTTARAWSLAKPPWSATRRVAVPLDTAFCSHSEHSQPQLSTHLPADTVKRF